MAELGPLELTTRRERILILIAVGVSLAVHLLFLFGTLLDLGPTEEEKERQLMIVRRLPEEVVRERVLPPVAQAPQRKEAVVEKGKPPEAAGKSQSREEESEEPPARTPLDELEKPISPEPEKENRVTILTDLNRAFFRLEGPAESQGEGTFWEKKGLPEGEYTVTFGTVEGYLTPEPQTDTLDPGGAVVFMGRYTRMTQVSVETNLKAASYRIVKPDGRDLLLDGTDRGMFKGLPLGSYTIIFKDMPGYRTPGPQTKTLEEGVGLNFSGFYLPGKENEEKEAPVQKAARRPGAHLLDRRIKMVVKSYPETGIEENYGAVTYPEVAIEKENYQEGWSQVYLRVFTDRGGRIEKVVVERPRPAEQARFGLLIDTVRHAVSRWEFDPVEAEVHVDVRFFVEK